MAEIADTGGGGHKKGGKVRSKKMSTKIDFTPMVDLGFLLITFFMLTTTLNKPQIMAVVLPEKDKIEEKDQPPVKEGKVITLLLGANDKVYYYNGITDPKLDSCDYGQDGLRKVLLEKITDVDRTYGKMEFKTKNKETGAEEPIMGTATTVLIKPTKDARYKNLVDALDEMAICQIRSYVMLDISTAEEEFIKNPAKGMNVNPTTAGK